MPTDLLELAIWGVDYWLSEKPPVDSVVIGFIIDRHPCDDLPYVAWMDVAPARIDGTEIGTWTEQFDGEV